VATDPQNPEQLLGSMQPMDIAAALRQHRDRIEKLPPEVQKKTLDLVFRKYFAPKLKASGLSPEELGTAEEQWRLGVTGKAALQLPSSFGQRPTETTRANKASAVGTGALASAFGMMANVLRGYRKLPGEGPKDTKVNEFLDKAIKDYESHWSELKKLSEETAPGYAKAGEVGGAVVVSGPAWKAGMEAVPTVAAKLPIAGKLLKGALGGASVAPLYSSEPKFKEFAEGGAAGELLLGGIGERLSKRSAARLASRAARLAERASKSGKLPKEAPQAEVSLVNSIAKDLGFDKDYNLLDPKDQHKITLEIQRRSEVAQKAEQAAKGAKRPKEISKKRWTETQKIAQEMHQKSYEDLGEPEQQAVRDEVQKRVQARKGE
jgi:hypothetical protein